MRKRKAGQKKLGIAVSLDPQELKRLSDEELAARFHKRVFPAILRRMRARRAEEPWHQWSYGFF
jgi:hypothetical protein